MKQIRNLPLILFALFQLFCKHSNANSQQYPKDTTNNVLAKSLLNPRFKPIIKPVSFNSPIIERLNFADKLRINAFWDSISKCGTPMIERVKNDTNTSIMTFLYRERRDDREFNIEFRSIREDTSFGDMKLRHIPKTDIWYRSYKVPKEITIAYRFFYMDDSRKVKFVDPLNHFYVPAKLREGADNYNVYYCFQDSSKAWFYEKQGVPKGTLGSFQFYSEILKNSHEITMYLPNGYDKSKQYPFILFFDAAGYLDVISTPTILDNLFHEKQIPPMIAVFIDTRINRTQELGCYRPFADFVATELIPHIRKQYNITTDPSKALVSGASLGGLSSGYLAFTYPQIFGNVLSQAGAFIFNNSYLMKAYESTARLPLNIYMDCGVLEENIYGNRDMYNMLKSKGYKPYYQEYQGFHDKTCWRKTLSDGLMVLCKGM